MSLHQIRSANINKLIKECAIMQALMPITFIGVAFASYLFFGMVYG